jgi:SAM-dependent methyltransferase
MNDPTVGESSVPEESRGTTLYKKDFWSKENLNYSRPHYRLEKAARIVNRLARGKKSTLLDVGCGPAALMPLLRSNIQYYGIDIAIHDPAPNLIEADVVSRPIRFDDKRFDIVIAQGFFEYAGAFQAQKFAEISDILNDGGIFIASYVNFGHRDRAIYWPYSNVQPLGDFRESLTQHFKIKKSFPTSHNWRHSEPRRKIIRAVNIYTNISVPLISPVLGVEYFFICSKLSFRGDFTSRVIGELISLLPIAPSTTDAERLLVITPELADVLSAIITPDPRRQLLRASGGMTRGPRCARRPPCWKRRWTARSSPPEHAFILQMMLDNIDHYSAQIAVLDETIAVLCEPRERQVAQLDAIPGFGVTTAQDLVGEIGTDVSASPTAGTCAPGPAWPSARRNPAAGAKAAAPPARATHTSAAPSARPPPVSASPGPSSAPSSAGELVRGHELLDGRHHRLRPVSLERRDHQREAVLAGQQPDGDLRLQAALLREAGLPEAIAPVGLEIQDTDVVEDEAGRAESGVRGAGGRQPTSRASPAPENQSQPNTSGRQITRAKRSMLIISSLMQLTRAWQ